MANYSMAASTKFLPYSYERYLAPLAAYNQAALSQEDLISDLSTKANVWEGLANLQTDKKAYEQYKTYANDLQAQADTLAEKGLYEGSRRALMDLKNRYSKEIVPIENAYNTRKQQAELQLKARAAHPDMLYGRDASTTSLDEYLKNPQYDALAQQYSGLQLQKNVEDAASALAREAHANPNIKATLLKILPYQYYAELERTGFSSDDVYKAIHSADGSPILKQIAQDAIKASGITGWDNYEAIKSQAEGYANQGLWKAVGTTKFGPVTDQFGMQSALETQRHKHALAEAEAAKQQPQTYEPGIPIDTDDVSFGAKSSKEVETVYNNMKAILGMSGGNRATGGSKVGYHPIQVSGSNGKSGYVAKAVNANGSKNFNVADKNGYLLSEDAFAKQGKTVNDKNILRHYYKTAIIPAINSVGAGGSRHFSNIYAKGYDYLKNSGATHITMPSLRFGDNKKVFENKIGNMVDNMQGAYEVTGLLGDYSKGLRYNAKDLASLIKDNEDRVAYNASFDKGKEGLLISVGELKFFVPSANMSSTAKAGFKHYASNIQSIDSALSKLKKNRAGYVSKYGEAGVQQLETQLEASKNGATAEAIRNIGFSVAGEYDKPSAKLFKQE